MTLVRRAGAYGALATAALLLLLGALYLVDLVSGRPEEGAGVEHGPLSPTTGEVVMGLLSIVVLFVLCTVVAGVLLRRRDDRAG